MQTLRKTVKKVGIIGGGQSGLASAKYAVENGLSPVIFEKCRIPGGLWAPNENQTNIWDDLHSNLSYNSMSFSDHFYPKNSEVFVTKNKVHDYLMSYAKRFDLEKYYRLQTKVEQAIQIEDKKWKINSINTETNTKTSEVFDFLIVASGLYQKPRIPKIENQENFKGKIMHSSEFKLNDESLKDKTVITVGICHSGTDISTHLVDHARSVTNIFNRPFIVTKRFIRFKSVLNRHLKNQFHILPIDLYLNSRGFKASQSLTKEEKKEFYFYKLSKLNLEQTNKDLSHPELFFDLEKESPRVAISDNYYGFVKQGKIIPKKTSIQRFEEDGVILADGSFEKADVVLFSTGYDSYLEYFNDSINKILGVETNQTDYKMQYLLYNSTFHPSLENMAMIYQTEGVYLIAAELQSRLANSVFSGKMKLPNHEIMHKEIEKNLVKRNRNFRGQYPYGSQVDVIDTLAKELDILPNFQNLKTDNPELYHKLWENVIMSCHFRINENISFDILNEVEDLVTKNYEFNDDDERKSISISEIAQKFNENQNSRKVSMHLFKT